MMSYSGLQGSRLAALIGLLGLGLSAAHAQLMPPDDFFEWSGGGGNGLWQTGTNWIGGPTGNGGVPTIDADVFFANEPPNSNPDSNPYQAPLTVTNSTFDLSVRSLWFDTGREYTVSGINILGEGLEDGGHLITGLNTDPSEWQSEHNIVGDVITLAVPSVEGATWQIASYSAGGLRIGTAFHFSDGSALKQTGGGAIHFAGEVARAGHLTIATDAGHMILSGNNSGWSGSLTVNHGFLVATANNALGSTHHPGDNAGDLRTVVVNETWSGATLAFRPKFVGPGLNNSAGMSYTTAQSITVTGRGYRRPWGSANPYDPHSQLNLAPVGAIYNDGGNNTFAGDITTTGEETWFGSRDGVLTLTGRLLAGDIGWGPFLSFVKVGRGVIALANGNPGWDEGQLTISEGVLRVSHANALNQQNSLIVFYDVGTSGVGGILELGAGNFSGTLGIDDPGHIGWDGVNDSGGFSAYGANRQVTLNNNAELTWGSGSNGNGSTGGFVNAGALLLGSDYGTHQIRLNNAIKFNAANREIRVARGATTAAHALLNGKLSGTGGILKTGLGTLWLNSTLNNYTGVTLIREGVLGGRVPTASRIDLDGGVLGINQNFARNLGGGTATNRIRWLPNRDGGFAAYGNNNWIVTLGTAGSIVSFGQTNFISANNALIFGAYDANGTVSFNNRLGLRQNATSRIRLISGTTNGDRADVVFSQKFYGPSAGASTTPSNRNYNLLFEGDGRADITQAHTATDWQSAFLQVRGAELRLNQAGTLQGLTGNWFALLGGGWEFSPGTLRADWGGTVTLDNQGSHNSLTTGGQSVTNRLFDQINIALNAGNFRLWGGTQNLVETAGELWLEGGANTLQVRTPIGVMAPLTRLHLSKLVHDGLQHPTINFIGVGLPLEDSGQMLSFANVSKSDLGRPLPYATVNGTDWAQIQTQYGLNLLTAYTGYQTGNESNWNASHNVSLGTTSGPYSGTTLSGERWINSLRLINAEIDSDGHALEITSGAILATGSQPTGIWASGAAVTTVRALYAHVYNTASVGLQIDGEILASGLVKTGPGLLLLSGEGLVGDDTMTTRIHEGTLALSKTTSNYLGAYGGTIIVGDRAGTDILRLDRAEQIANNASVTLRGGHPDPARFLMAEGILQFNGINGSGVGIRETIGNLTVEGRGVIDFRGGEAGRANFLIITGLLAIDANSRLFIRNWYEFEDYILINRNGVGNGVLERITFEGYGPALLRDWDSTFYQITPMPEPATYGAILGAVGLGLWGWRKKHRSREAK